jgi:hypothetical protein
MPFAVKASIVAIIAGIAVLNDISNKTTEAEIILSKLESCGVDIDSLDAYQKDELVNMNEIELYHVCEQSLKTEAILRQQQELMNTLNSININQ